MDEPAKNDITGDTIITKPSSEKYAEGYERIFMGNNPRYLNQQDYDDEYNVLLTPYIINREYERTHNGESHNPPFKSSDFTIGDLSLSLNEFSYKHGWIGVFEKCAEQTMVKTFTDNPLKSIESIKSNR